MSGKRFKIYVVGGGYNYIRLMYTLGCDGAKGLDDADVVLFTGGEDVNPEMYGEVCMPKTHFNRLRDEKEKVIYEEALRREIPMVGICRGGQFLNVMNGGKLWQHVNNHALSGSHIARIEVPPFTSSSKRRSIAVTSTHHQMMRPTEEAFILLTAQEATIKDSPGLTVTRMIKGCDEDADVEACWYEDTRCLCFQPHPEYEHATSTCVDFFEECLDNYVYPNIPLDAEGKEVLEKIKEAHARVDEEKKKEILTVPKTRSKKKEKN